MNSDPDPLVQIYLLRTFEVRSGKRAIHANEWPRKKAASLLKLLALNGRLLKEQAVEYLWPESDPKLAANNLYKTLHILRQKLDSALSPGISEALLRFEDGVLSLLPSVWVDTHVFEQLCTAVTGKTNAEQAAILEQILDLYRSDLLPDDLYADWTLLPREAYFRCQRDARLKLAVYHSQLQNYAAAIAYLHPLLAYDPADESVHRELMRFYALSGQRRHAIQQYHACVEALSAELDAEPEKETSSLYALILSGELAALPVQARQHSAEPLPLPTDKPRARFFGREKELKKLKARMEAAAAGEGGILFISGEAGQGKTSLMAHFADLVSQEYPETVIATGACQTLFEITDPYLPFRDLIAMLNGDWQRPWCGGEISATQAQRLLAIAPQTTLAIESYAPDLVDIIAPAASATAGGKAPSRDLTQRQVFYQMGQMLRALSSQQPLLLLLDDLQWIDPASANLLFYLGRQLVKSAVLVIGAYRPGEVHHREKGEHPLTPVVQELVRYQGEILIDLDASFHVEGRRFIDALLDSESNRLDATFREELFRRTKGHPLFTIELLRALQDQRDLFKDEIGLWSAATSLDWSILPARVEAVIARRIEGLPQEYQQLLATASVEGESFTVEVTAHVLGRDVRSLLPQISRDLDQGYRLVREQGEWRLGKHTYTRYQFRHNLFQQYLYHRLSTAERRAIHAEIAALLEKLGEDDPGSLAVSLAHHFTAAGDEDKAAHYLRRAGDEARRRVAMEEAAHFYYSALQYWQGNDMSGKANVLHRLGETLLALGRPAEAIKRFSEAGELYSKAGLRAGMGAIERLTGRAYWEQGERARAMDCYHRALSLLEEEPQQAELARAISAIAQMHMLGDEYDEALKWGSRALLLARELELEDVLVHALTSVGNALATMGQAEKGLAMLTESLERAESSGLPHDAGRAYAGLGDTLVSHERYEEARTIYERMLDYARKVQAGMFEGVALVQLGNLDWWEGRWRQAWGRRQEIMEWMASGPESTFVKVWASNLLGMIYNDLGQPEKARAILVENSTVARSAQETQTTIPHLLQLARCAQSDEEFSSLMKEILSLVDRTAYPRYEIFPAMLTATSWLAQNSAGSPASLERLIKVDQLSNGLQSTAILEEGRGRAAGYREDWEQAAGYYAAAIKNWGKLKRPYDRLRALAGLIHVLSSNPRQRSEAATEQAREQAALIVNQLTDELDDVETKQAFLAAPLIKEVWTVLGIRR